MRSSDESPAPDIFRLRRLLAEWFDGNSQGSVAFTEKLDVSNDPHDDYLVVYEAVFEPIALDQMRVEVWVTDDGYTAVFLENFDRIARRLGMGNRPAGSSAGHEPMAVSEGALMAIFDAVAAGEIAIRARPLLFGLGSRQAFASRELRESLAQYGYPHLDWLAVDPPSRFFWPTHLLQYRSWSNA